MYGFVITKLGLNYLAKLVAGHQMQISDVVVGSGRVPDGTNLALMTDLMMPERRATSTTPIVENHVCSFIIEYRTDLILAADGSKLPGGNPASFWINEFGIFVVDPDLGRIMLYYGALGDYPQHCAAYVGGAVDIRRYPVSIGLSDDVTVVLNYPAIAWITAEDLDKHNKDPYAHPGHKLDVIFDHKLDTYPITVVTDTRYGAGMGGCGEIPCGGEPANRMIRSIPTYLDSNRLTLEVAKKYEGVPEVTQIREGIYILMFADDVAVRVSLMVDYATVEMMTSNKFDSLCCDLNAMATVLVALSSSTSSNINRLDNAINTLSLNALNMDVLNQKIQSVPIGAGN